MRKAFLLLLTLAACESQHDDVHVTSAATFTTRYAKSRFADWKVRANAAGGDCDYAVDVLAARAQIDF